MYWSALTFRFFRRLAICGMGILLISLFFKYAFIYTVYKFMASVSYIWNISRIMEISHVNVCLTLTSTFRILRSVSVSMARNFWPVVASCQRITLNTYLCLPHFKHRYCVCCVDFWIKHWYCIELVNKRFPLYYIYCAEEMNLINVSADIHHSVSCGNVLVRLFGISCITFCVGILDG